MLISVFYFHLYLCVTVIQDASLCWQQVYRRNPTLCQALRVVILQKTWFGNFFSSSDICIERVSFYNDEIAILNSDSKKTYIL